MHETGIVRDLVRRLEQAAREAGAERVSGVAVWLGALSHFSPAHFREHFEDAARGTVAQGAALDIEASNDPAHPDAQRVMSACRASSIFGSARPSKATSPTAPRTAGTAPWATSSTNTRLLPGGL